MSLVIVVAALVFLIDRGLSLTRDPVYVNRRAVAVAFTDPAWALPMLSGVFM
jgi:hypothetical protein